VWRPVLYRVADAAAAPDGGIVSTRIVSTLELRNVSVDRGGRRIFRNADLSVSPGRLKAIVGPNGSGKSTLLRVLGGMWSPTEGSVLLDGQPLSSLPRSAVARAISFVPQNERISFEFTVEEVVAMGRYPHRGRFAAESVADRRVISAAMERCDIGHLRDRVVSTLSSGEHQRVLIARTLAVQSQFILLDEPTANLDVEHSIAVLELCRELALEGKAIVLASHDLNAVARYAADVALIEAGRFVDCGPRAEVLTARNLERAFGVRAEVLASGDGYPVYVFHQRGEA
jgi:iron complex transport system ATP-binding protein